MTISKKIVYAPIFKEFTCKFKRMCRESVTRCRYRKSLSTALTLPPKNISKHTI